mmetsp:Transcript_42552/g.85377  ORF Transcript_42552/g.85377 Transcript_42552/m.85377 type:complete len:252 (-) Transcript_42552:436-1191(-)
MACMTYVDNSSPSILARPRAMLCVASGRPACLAACAISASRVSSPRYWTTSAATSSGSLLYSPKPISRTKSTFPDSWPGRKLLRTHGSPITEASAMVPGPALVTSRSEAAIHSSMLLTKPRTLTCTLDGHRAFSRDATASEFRPQITTSWLSSGLPRPSPRPLPMACAAPTKPPMPSPPPTTSTVGTPATSPSSLRHFSFSVLAATDPSSNPSIVLDSFQKPRRIGKPCCTICSAFNPRPFACTRNASLGT